MDYDIAKVAGLGFTPMITRAAREWLSTRGRRVVVGMTLVGPAVGEMIYAATIAVAGEVPIDRLWHAVPSFPTISEVWLRLLEALDAEIICPT